MQLESRSQLASARASRGLKADLYLQFGLSQTAARLRDSYRDPLDQQYVSLSVVIPILDWGERQGKGACGQIEHRAGQYPGGTGYE